MKNITQMEQNHMNATMEKRMKKVSAAITTPMENYIRKALLLMEN